MRSDGPAAARTAGAVVLATAVGAVGAWTGSSLARTAAARASAQSVRFMSSEASPKGGPLALYTRLLEQFPLATKCGTRCAAPSPAPFPRARMCP